MLLFLALGEGLMHGLDNTTTTTEPEYSISFIESKKCFNNDMIMV